MHLCTWGVHVRASIFLIQSMLLSPQGGKAFIPLALLPPLTLHSAMDERRSPCSLTRLPHSKLALQLLQGSTVWSCPVRLQTKQQWDKHNLRPPNRVACNTNIFHKGGWRWTQTFHILCKALTFCHRALVVCVFIVQTFGLICLCVCVFLSNFRIASSPLWQIYCPRQVIIY